MSSVSPGADTEQRLHLPVQWPSDQGRPAGWDHEGSRESRQGRHDWAGDQGQCQGHCLGIAVTFCKGHFEYSTNSLHEGFSLRGWLRLKIMYVSIVKPSPRPSFAELGTLQVLFFAKSLLRSGQSWPHGASDWLVCLWCHWIAGRCFRRDMCGGKMEGENGIIGDENEVVGFFICGSSLDGSWFFYLWE